MISPSKEEPLEEVFIRVAYWQDGGFSADAKIRTQSHRQIGACRSIDLDIVQAAAVEMIGKAINVVWDAQIDHKGGGGRYADRSG